MRNLGHATSVVLVLAMAGAATAVTRPVAVVDISDDSSGAAEAILYEAAFALARVPGYDVKDVDAILNAGAAANQMSDVRTAQGFHKVGVEAFAGGKYEEAVEQLESAARLMEQSYAFLSDFSEYGAVLLELAAAKLRANEEGAEATFERAAIIKADLSATTLPQEFAQQYEEAKARVKTRALGAIEITSSPAHAEVWVDGRFRGIAPTTVAGLREGEHYVVVRRTGYLPKTIIARAKAGEPSEHAVELTASRKKPLLDQLRQRLGEDIDNLDTDRTKGGDGVRQLGSLLFSELGVVIKTSGPPAAKQLDMYFFHAPTRTLLNEVHAKLDWSYRNRKAIQRLVQQLVDIDFVKALGGDTTDPIADNADDGAVVTKWWFWTIIGVVVAGGATVAAVLLTQEDDTPPFSKNGTGALVIQF